MEINIPPILKDIETLVSLGSLLSSPIFWLIQRSIKKGNLETELNFFKSATKFLLTLFSIVALIAAPIMFRFLKIPTTVLEPPLGKTLERISYYEDSSNNAFVFDGVNPSKYYQTNIGYIGRDTWYVYGRTQEVGYDIKNLNYNQFLDKWSYLWAEQAKGLGLRVDIDSPQSGDIAVWTRYKHSGYIWAHCAFIEKERFGTVWVTESNLTDKPDGSTPARIKPGVPRVVVTEDEGYITDNWGRSSRTGVYLYDAPYNDPPPTGFKLLKKFDQLDIMAEDYRQSSSGEWYYWYQLKMSTPGGDVTGWARLEERRPDLNKNTGDKDMSVPNFEFNFTGIDTTPHFINKYWPDLPDLQYIHLENRSTN